MFLLPHYAKIPQEKKIIFSIFFPNKQKQTYKLKTG